MSVRQSRVIRLRLPLRLDGFDPHGFDVGKQKKLSVCMHACPRLLRGAQIKLAGGWTFLFSKLTDFSRAARRQSGQAPATAIDDPFRKCKCFDRNRGGIHQHSPSQWKRTVGLGWGKVLVGVLVQVEGNNEWICIQNAWRFVYFLCRERGGVRTAAAPAGGVSNATTAVILEP